MKIFYCGSVCGGDVFNKTVAESKVKPSASAQNFETALIKGFSACDGVEVTVASAESVAAFPNGNRLFLKKRKDKLTSDITADIVPAINLPYIKNVCHANGTAALFRRWLKTCKADEPKCAFLYGLYPSVAKKMLKECRKSGCSIFAVITDVPATMFTYTKSKNILKRLFSGSYRNRAVELQDKFDGYVFLTKQMSEAVAPSKPFVVIEAIADSTLFDSLPDVKKAEPRTVMYAGALYRKYGVDMIVSAFEKTENDCELQLFGSGDMESELAEKSKENPRIRYCGRVSRDEILKREREATLLLNFRNGEDEYTKYSFPSKMTEYMLSGTPLFTSRLDGIPEEYYAYVYSTSAKDAEQLAREMDEILSDGEALSEMGRRAREFVMNKKNEKCQAGKIVDFLRETVQNESRFY